MNIYVVVPTIREQKYKDFLYAWKMQFEQYDVTVIKVTDGEIPDANGWTAQELLGEDKDLIYNFNDGVRNLGIYYALKCGADIIISLDDDVKPDGDTIGDHIKALSKKYSTGWLNTTNEVYMRGFPYGIREQAECVLSHGTWKGVADFDASTQLILGTPKITPRTLPVPKGVLFPMCIMNVAFTRKIAPYMYQAPATMGINRFADIWGGIEAKKDIDELGYCAVTGYASVIHDRASDPFVNLEKEAKGIRLNEKYGEDEYFKLFFEKRERWIKKLKEII